MPTRLSAAFLSRPTRSSTCATRALSTPSTEADSDSVSWPDRPACIAVGSSITPTRRPGWGRRRYGTPSMVAVPTSAVFSPHSRRMVVDLPAPFGPRNPVTVPGVHVKVTSWTPADPKVLVSS